MTDIQLLAHLLNMAGANPSRARENAHILLEPHLSLEQVLALPKSFLLTHPDLTENEAAFLLLLSALMHRYRADLPSQSIFLGDQVDVRRMILPHFQNQNTERVYAFFLDKDLHLLSSVLAAQGGVSAVSCSASRVLDLALSHNAHTVILAHNHPDGATEFSKSDLLSTSVLFQELCLVDISLLDHYLLAGNEIISLRRLVLERKIHGISFPLPPWWFPPAS